MTETAKIEDIEALARTYAARRRALRQHVMAMERAIAALRAKGTPRLKRLAEAAVARRAALEAAVAANPGLFKRPRSRTLHGIRLGFAKSKGRLVFTLAADAVVRLIFKHFPERADTLVKTTETPVKAALMTLSAAELKKLGCGIEGAGDEVVVRPVDGEIDKLVEAFIGAAEAKDPGDPADPEDAEARP